MAKKGERKHDPGRSIYEEEKGTFWCKRRGEMASSSPSKGREEGNSCAGRKRKGKEKIFSDFIE